MVNLQKGGVLDYSDGANLATQVLEREDELVEM
jgi:hypothetical protein